MSVPSSRDDGACVPAPGLQGVILIALLLIIVVPLAADLTLSVAITIVGAVEITCRPARRGED